MTAGQLEDSIIPDQLIPTGEIADSVLPTYTLREAMSIQRPTWLIEGLISRSITLISGQPKSGKSALVQKLIVSILGAEPFLDRAFLRPVNRIIVVATDADAITEYRDRVLQSNITPEMAADRLILIPAQQLHADFCIRVQAELRPRADDLVIWDHLSDMAGDFNSQTDVSAIFAAMRRAVGDAAMIVVAHSTTATGPNGYSSKKPLGSTVIMAKARWSVHVEKRPDGTRTITSQGNASSGEVIRLSVGASAADLHVLEVSTEAEKASTRKKRKKETRDIRGQQIEWYRANCLGLPNSEAARRLAIEFGDSHRTWANRLGPSGWMGQALART
ncbi:AAA family ATPase [Arthrobacter subterraneus]|uniref:AAA family ATPase n=1 Tax=Arthrobacter subterraneus TaxID=335973 RepID=UPI0038087B61